jgi:hypothetical protein
MRKKLAMLALTAALVVPAGALASPPNFECPGGPPGHCKSGQGNHSQSQQQQQQQQQTQSQSQCILVIAVLQPATC